jgi:hypothetical protein
MRQLVILLINMKITKSCQLEEPKAAAQLAVIDNSLYFSTPAVDVVPMLIPNLPLAYSDCVQ